MMRTRRSGNCPFRVADLQVAVLRHGQVILADLITLRQVRIIVVLAVPFGEGGDLAVQRQGRLERQVKSLSIHDRQTARHPDADRTGLRIGGRAELGTAAAEQLGLGFQLDVDFQPDHRGVRRLQLMAAGFPRVPIGMLLVVIGGMQQTRFVKGRCQQLNADRQSRSGDCRTAWTGREFPPGWP